MQPAGVFGPAQFPPDPPELDPELDPDEDPELLPELPPEEPPLDEPPEDPLDDPLEEPLDEPLEPPLPDPESLLPPSSDPASPKPWKMLVAPPQWAVAATTITSPSEPGQRKLAPIASPSLRPSRTSTAATPRPTGDCYFPA